MTILMHKLFLPKEQRSDKAVAEGRRPRLARQWRFSTHDLKVTSLSARQ